MKKNKKLEKLCKMDQLAVKEYVFEELKRLSGKAPVNKDGFVFYKGTHPVLLVAHMDTVHSKPPIEIVHKDNIISSPEGIGGDDRCGIYIILKLFEELDCSVLFCEDEEIGCIGVNKFIKSPYITYCKDINYIIEFDRRGSNDAVFYECDNGDFEEFILSTGFFKANWGSCSDISYLAPAIGCAAVNLSSGYYNEHTVEEYINILEVERVIEEAKKLLNIEPIFYEYIEAEDFFNESFYDSIPYHLYAENELGEVKAYEIFARSEMEALGIFLSESPTLTSSNVLDIYTYF